MEAARKVGLNRNQVRCQSGTLCAIDPCVMHDTLRWQIFFIAHMLFAGACRRVCLKTIFFYRVVAHFAHAIGAILNFLECALDVVVAHLEAVNDGAIFDILFLFVCRLVWVGHCAHNVHLPLGCLPVCRVVRILHTNGFEFSFNGCEFCLELLLKKIGVHGEIVAYVYNPRREITSRSVYSLVVIIKRLGVSGVQRKRMSLAVFCTTRVSRLATILSLKPVCKSCGTLPTLEVATPSSGIRSRGS